MTKRYNLVVCVITSVIATILIMCMLSGGRMPEEASTIRYVDAYLSGQTQTGEQWVTDSEGNEWVVTGLPITQDDALLLVIDNNNTTNKVKDDVIIGVYLLAKSVVQEAEAQE